MENEQFEESFDKVNQEVMKMLDPFDGDRVHDYLLTMFRTKQMNSKGKLVKRKTIPQQFLFCLLTHTLHPFTIIVYILRRIGHVVDDVDRAMVKSLVAVTKTIMGLDSCDLSKHEFFYYQTWDGLLEKMRGDRADVYRTIKEMVLDERESVWICHYVFALEFQVDGPPGRFDSITINETKSIMDRLVIAKGYNELCLFISKFKNLTHLIDFEQFVDILVSHNDIQNLTLLFDHGEIQERVFGRLESEMYDIIVNQNRSRSLSWCQNVPTIVQKFGGTEWTDTYPCIHLATLHGLVRHCVRLMALTINTTENKNYDTDAVVASYVDRLTFVIWKLPKRATTIGTTIEPQRLLTEYSIDQLIQHGFTQYVMVLRDSVTDECFRTPQPLFEVVRDPDYFTTLWPIVWIGSTSEVSRLQAVVDSTTLMGLDCEWTWSPLSIIQLSCQDSQGTGVTFIIDCLHVEGRVVHDILLQFHCPILGFDCTQDLPKLHHYCSFTPVIVNLQRRGGLAKMVEETLHVKLDKRPRMSLWEKRPLDYFQVVYAASDSQVLIELYRKLEMK
jgi:hypothetical protein